MGTGLASLHLKSMGSRNQLALGGASSLVLARLPNIKALGNTENENMIDTASSLYTRKNGT